MKRKVLVVVPILVLAFSILFISVFRTAAVRYEIGGPALTYQPEFMGDNRKNIDYQLAYPGKVLPDSPLWPLKAMRDKIWLWTTTDTSRQAELKLLFADKRLGSAEKLFIGGKAEIGLTTLSKAEKYLEEASEQENRNRMEGGDTLSFLVNLANASLKHYQVIEGIIRIAPEEARPTIIKFQEYSRNVFENSRNALLEKGETPPKNPFDF